MRFHGIQLDENSTITNAVIDSGTTFPEEPDLGELFFRTDLSLLHIYDGERWDVVGGEGAQLTGGAGISVEGNTVSNTGVLSITGTTNQITASTTSGTTTLSLPSAVSIGSTITVGSQAIVASGTNGGIQLTLGNPANSGYLEFMSGSSVRQGYIGFSSTNAPTDTGTIPYVAGTHAFTGTISGNLTGNVTGASSLNVLKAGDTMTGQLRITASGAAAPQLALRRTAETGDFTWLELERTDGTRALELICNTDVPAYGIPANAVGINAQGTAGLHFSTQDNLRMSIDGSGNVGIGTASPTNFGAGYTSVAVNGSTAGIFETMVNGASALRMFSTAGEARIHGVLDVPMTFFTNNAERMRLNGVGELSLNANIASTSTGTGSLVVTGGAGFSGTVYAGGFNGPLTGNVTGASSLNVLKAGDTMTGRLTINTGGGSNSANSGLDVINGTAYGLVFIARNIGGGFNPLVQAGDASIIVQSGAGPDGTAGLVIGHWSETFSGLRIASGGNVGIGIAAPVARLDVQATTGAQGIRILGRASDQIGTLELFANNGTTRQGYIQGTTGSLVISSEAGAGNVITLFTNSIERMRIASNGVVSLSANATSTSVSTGSLVVTGGAGFSGTVYAGGFNGPLTGASTSAHLLSGSDGTTFSSSNAVATSGSRSVSLAPNTYVRQLSLEFKNADLFNTAGGYSGLVTVAPFDGTSASTGDSSYQLLFSPNAQGRNSTFPPSLMIRAGIDTTWGAWSTMLHSANFNAWAPTLTGTGASGTWGISITGNAGSVGGYLPSISQTVSTIPVRDSNGWTYFNYLNSNTSNNENPTISQVIVTNGADDFYRKASVSHLTSNLSGTAPISITGSAGSVAWTNISGRPSTITGLIGVVDSVDADPNVRLSSGYYQRYPTFIANGWPVDGSWWHLHTTTHSAAALNYSMQLAASFFSNDLRYRSTNNSGTTTWSRVLLDTNYTNWAPSLTGAGASGTWGINITGNAATATSASSVAGISSNRVIMKRRLRISSGDSTSLNSSITALETGFTYGGSGEPTGPFIAFGGLGADIDYSCQLVGAYVGGNDFRIRTRDDDASIWNPWRIILTDGNYTSYSPSLTGTGASGTWGINITGSAGSATQLSGNAETAYLRYRGALDGTTVTNIDNAFTPGWYRVDRVGFSELMLDIGGAGSSTPRLQLTANFNDELYFRAARDAETTWDGVNYPGRRILHDGNYTSYSPSLTGSGASGTWGINITGSAGNTSSISSATGTSYTWTAIQSFRSTARVGLNDRSGALELFTNGGAGDSSTMSFHRAGHYGLNFGLDSDNVVRIGGWSDGLDVFRMQLSTTQVSFPGEIYTAGNIRIQGASPTITLQDTDHRTAYIHVNDNLLYVLRGGTNSGVGGWDSGPNGRHPMTMNLGSGDVVFSGDVTAFSDIRLKKNVKVISNALTKVEALRGVTFEHVDGAAGTGLIAQELQEVLPEAVKPAPNSEYLTVAYGNTVGLLVEAIKELSAQVQQLKTELQQLKEKQ